LIWKLSNVAGTGKGRPLVKHGARLVSCVIFGGDLDPMADHLDFNKLLTKLRQAAFKATLFNK